MNFYLNFRKIIEILECTNIELANAANLDQTIISKFKNNIRIPKLGSQAFDALINGIYLLTIEKNKIMQISNLTGKGENLKESIFDYLINTSNDIRLNKEDNSLVGANLDIIMRTFHISNVMLAKHINKDSSLISKYKTGKRYILKNDKLAMQISEYVEKQIIRNKLQNEANTLFFSSKNDNLKENVFAFLFSPSQEKNQLNSFLERMNEFRFSILPSIPPIESVISEEITQSQKTSYVGVKEFRNAVARFLARIALNNTPTTLYLYSDENMNWLLQNKDFYNIWKMLMLKCLSQKNEIKIIHNIDRDPNEMFKAIESWLPLYMTGLIEPYYNLKNNNNFTHTLFIAEKNAVINSASIISNQDCNIYFYSEEKKIIQSFKSQYLELLTRSKKLVKIYLGENIEKKLQSRNDYLEYAPKDLNNLIIMIKKDETEVLILKKNTPTILFGFTYQKMITIIKKYLITSNSSIS